MSVEKINKLIIEKVDKATCDGPTKEFIKLALEFERDYLNDELSRYTDKYKKWVEYFSKKKGGKSK